MGDMSVYSRNSGDFQNFMLMANTAASVYSAAKIKNIDNSVSSLSNALKESNRNIDQGLHELGHGIFKLGAKFDYGMNLISTKLEAVSQENREIIARLQNLEELLKTPEAIKGQEWLERGLVSLSKGMLENAEKSFLESENILHEAFFPKYYLAKLYLYGIDDDENLIDLDKAIIYWSEATKIAKGESSQSNEFYKYIAESQFNHGVALYVKGNKEFADDKESSNSIYESSMARFNDSIKSYLDFDLGNEGDEFYEAHYHRAKLLSLMREPNEALKSIKKCSDHDLEYLNKSLQDADFDLHPELVIRLKKYSDGLLNELRVRSGNLDKTIEKFNDEICRHENLSVVLDKKLQNLTDTYSNFIGQVRSLYKGALYKKNKGKKKEITESQKEKLVYFAEKHSLYDLFIDHKSISNQPSPHDFYFNRLNSESTFFNPKVVLNDVGSSIGMTTFLDAVSTHYEYAADDDEYIISKKKPLADFYARVIYKKINFFPYKENISRCTEQLSELKNITKEFKENSLKSVMLLNKQADTIESRISEQKKLLEELNENSQVIESEIANYRPQFINKKFHNLLSSGETEIKKYADDLESEILKSFKSWF